MADGCRGARRKMARSSACERERKIKSKTKGRKLARQSYGGPSFIQGGSSCGSVRTIKAATVLW